MPLSPVSSTVEAGLVATLATRLRSRRDGVRDPDDVVEAERPRLLGAQLPDFPPQPRRLERARDGRHDVVKVEGLVGEVIRADAHRFDGRLDGRKRGEEDDQDVLVVLLDLAQDGHAVRVRQLVVEQDQIDTLAQLFERPCARLGLEHLIALALQPFGQRPADQGFVIDNENGWGRHGN